MEKQHSRFEGSNYLLLRFKTINYINPSYMKEIFELNRRRDTDNKRLIVQTPKSMKYGSYTLRSLGPGIWNKLLSNLRL